jgi:hypothetical protein
MFIFGIIFVLIIWASFSSKTPYQLLSKSEKEYSGSIFENCREREEAKKLADQERAARFKERAELIKSSPARQWN